MLGSCMPKWAWGQLHFRTKTEAIALALEPCYLDLGLEVGVCEPLDNLVTMTLRESIDDGPD